MGKKPNVVSAILIALGFLSFNLVAVGCSSSPLRGYNSSSVDGRSDVVTLSSDATWQRWQKPNNDLIRSEISDPGIHAKVQLGLCTSEEGPSHGNRGIVVRQVRPGTLLVEVQPTSKDRPALNGGQMHGFTMLPGWFVRKYGILGEDSVVSGTANVLNNREKPNSRITCFLFLARNQEEYAEHAAHVKGAPATLAEYLAMYPDRVVVETPMAAPAGSTTAAAPAPAGGTLKR